MKEKRKKCGTWVVKKKKEGEYTNGTEEEREEKNGNGKWRYFGSYEKK